MNCKNCGYGLKQSCGDFEKIICTYEEGECVKIAELKEQNTNLQEMLKTERSVTCKEEYLKKVTELEQENAELIHENARLVTVIDKSKSWGISPLNALIINNLDTQLTKAKELLLELYDCIPSSMADSCKEILQKVALFFKDSEVEK